MLSIPIPSYPGGESKVQSSYQFNASQLPCWGEGVRSQRLEDEEQYFSCDDCKYKTNSKAYMKDHVRRMHKASARLGVWMCMAGGCKEKPKSFLNNHQQEKHQQDHANVKCPECGQLFSAVRNMKRHIKTKHKAVESNNISRNSNESVRDENFNPDINDVAFEICN